MEIQKYTLLRTARMALITLTTDLGPKDPDGASLRGLVWRELLRAGLTGPVVDITHAIPPRNHSDAAYILRLSYPHYPEGTIHIVMVDSAPSETVFPVGITLNGHHFLGMNHGGLALIEPDTRPTEIVRLSFPEQPDLTHPADLLAFAATQLSRGRTLSAVGAPMETMTILHPIRPSAIHSNQIHCEVQFIDHYGNAVTNVHQQWLEPLAAGKAIRVVVRNQKVTKWPKNLRDVGLSGTLFLRFNRGGYLEICLSEPGDNGTNTAASLLGLTVHSPVMIQFA